MNLLNQLVAWWKLDETSGTRYDAHVNGLDLTDVGGVPSAAGKQGLACAPNATSDALNRASDAFLQMGDIDFTIAGWFYCGNTARNIRISRKMDGALNEYEIGHATTTPFRLFFRVYNGANPYTVTPGNYTLATSTWYFFVAWHDAANNKIWMRINDNDIYQASKDVAAGGVNVSDSVYVLIGNTQEDRLDEVAIWKRLLTSDEKTWLYNSGTGRSFDELMIPPAVMRYYRRTRIPGPISVLD